MKLNWSVYCYHFFLWSGYSVVGWLSKKDSVLAKSILLIMFFYLAYLIAFTILKTRKSAIIITFISLLFFTIGKKAVNFVF
jgi:hypothetical protein